MEQLRTQLRRLQKRGAFTRDLFALLDESSSPWGGERSPWPGNALAQSSGLRHTIKNLLSKRFYFGDDGQGLGEGGDPGESALELER